MKLDYNKFKQDAAKGNLFWVDEQLHQDKDVFPELTERYEEVIKAVNDLRLEVEKKLIDERNK